MRKIDLTGRRFGRLVVLKDAGRRRGLVLWLCHCECGSRAKVTSNNLRSGNTRSCGCQTGRPPIIHGHCRRPNHHGSPIYQVWRAMRQRCLNPNCRTYKYYGGRGIKICKRWSKFTNFLADMGERPEGYSLDRINNNGDYKPSNCKWATRSEQMENRRWFSTGHRDTAKARAARKMKAK